MNDAFEYWHKAGRCRSNPVFEQLAAVSVGVVDGVCLLDLDYREDSRAEVDMNLVMTGSGEFIEVQGTGERTGFDRAQLNRLLDLGGAGLAVLFEEQRRALGQAATRQDAGGSSDGSSGQALGLEQTLGLGQVLGEAPDTAHR